MYTSPEAFLSINRPVRKQFYRQWLLLAVLVDI